MCGMQTAPCERLQMQWVATATYDHWHTKQFTTSDA